MKSYLTEDEDETAVDQGMKDSEKEENTDSKQSISEEIPAMTAEPNEDNTQTIPRLSKIYQQQQQGETGRNKNWYDIREDASEERKSINLK